MTPLPTHPFLVHPRTGEPLRAVYRTRAGRLVWPVLGAAPDDPAPDAKPDAAQGQPEAKPDPAATADAKATDAKPDPNADPLGAGGLKALQEERAARKKLEAELTRLAPLQKLADALTGDGGKPAGKTELEQLAERLSGHEKELATERAARWRAEVAVAKKLTPDQAEWLRGDTKEEVEASADRLLAAFPAGAGTGPDGKAAGTGLKPDPSQGARSGGTATVHTGAALYAQRHPAKTPGN